MMTNNNLNRKLDNMRRSDAAPMRQQNNHLIDMNSNARAVMDRWRHRQKNAERRIIRFDERVDHRLESILERTIIHREPLEKWWIRQCHFRDVDSYEYKDADWREFKVGQTWGGDDVSAFFRRQVTIPERMAGERVFLRIYVGGDSLLRLDGVPYHGLDPFRSNVLLAEEAEPGRTYNIELESFVFWYPVESNYNVFEMAELVTVDPDVEAAYWDFVAIFKVLFMSDIDQKLEAFIETKLWDALLDVPIHEPDFNVFKEKLMEVRAHLQEDFFHTDRFKSTGLLHMVGHSHLDIVYQWPHREYIRKVGRTHATMLRLMERYPDFKFSQSSAKIYADMKEHFPNLFEQVKQRVAEGQWQPVGAFWLEPDCNLISGESFVRHILHGQRFWQEEFGLQSRVCWQPDVFGLSWALPQILKRSSIDVIMSNKFFVWNDTNPWRKNTFWWEGPDGSRVLTVIPPGHFIGMVDPDHMDRYWREYSDKETIGETIYTYGWGDGGGGVDTEMLECAARYGDFPGLVRTRFSHPEDTLLSIREKALEEDLPIWNDEMYLEAHRGTYTTKGRLKKLNRQSEVLYRDVEMMAVFAWGGSEEYPNEALDKGWKMLLGTQFHDALPGTHINEVYHYLLDEYEELQNIAHDIRERAADAIFGAEKGRHVLVFNSLMTERAGIISLPASVLEGRQLSDETGTPYVQQAVENFDGTAEALVEIRSPLPCVGGRIFDLTDTVAKPPPYTGLRADENLLENRFLRVEFNQKGEIVSLWDKEARRNVFAEGSHGNYFQLYEDRPGRYDAWDIVSTYVEHEMPFVGQTQLTVDETGPLRASLKLVRHCYDSVIVQRISLTSDSRLITFETEIDWHERQRLLKVGFPLDLNCRQATYDMAYGNIERPTHRNTKHDEAKFEVPAHWWMDMSEGQYGVALLNDSKYGHEGHDHWMRLTLLKGSISPDPHADREVHHFTYALLPHLGGWRDGGVMTAAAELNVPLYVRRTANPVATHSFIQCDAPNVMLEAVKQPEDGSRRLVLRLVEQHNAFTRAKIVFNHKVRSAYTCDLMENVEHELKVMGNTVEVEIRPYEIVTLLVN